ncbi:MAG: hypothetical protein K2U26_07875 [Cyclobacteriaceae bacterium]|nr:hypothetical protein [Cyclobacteriaceae bacterium]
MATTITKVRRIGNSRGILFSKSMLDKSGIKDTVKITVKNKTILISATPSQKKRKWSEVKKVKQKVDIITNTFDETEWTW